MSATLEAHAAAGDVVTLAREETLEKMFVDCYAIRDWLNTAPGDRQCTLSSLALRLAATVAPGHAAAPAPPAALSRPAGEVVAQTRPVCFDRKEGAIREAATWEIGAGDVVFVAAYDRQDWLGVVETVVARGDGPYEYSVRLWRVSVETGATRLMATPVKLHAEQLRPVLSAGGAGIGRAASGAR